MAISLGIYPTFSDKPIWQNCTINLAPVGHKFMTSDSLATGSNPPVEMLCPVDHPTVVTRPGFYIQAKRWNMVIEFVDFPMNSGKLSLVNIQKTMENGDL